MPEKCLFCGECAVLEDGIEGGAVQRICTECGTVASGVKTENGSSTAQVRIECYPFYSLKCEQLLCQSCGDSLPLILPSDNKICPECQAVSSGDVNDNEQEVAVQSESQRGSSSAPEVASCKSCKGTNLGLDSLGADERLVCRDCGTVAGSEHLMNDEFEIMTRSYNNSFLTLPLNACQPKKLRGRVAGHEKIAFLHNKFCFQQFIKEEALEMYNKVYEKPPVFFAHISTKEHMAAACVFIVCRQHDIPVSLVHFRKYVDRFSLFVKGVKIVLKSMNISLPHMTLTCQVEHMLGNSGFHAQTILKVHDILFLCRQAWLTQGRSREGLIMIAAYYAYISSNQCTGFISMREFRRIFHFPNISLLLQGECKNLFLKLASSIPWVSKKSVKSTTIHKYIDDILKYQNSLFQLAFTSQDHDTSLSGRNTSEENRELDGEPTRKKRNMHISTNNSCGDFQKEVLLPSVLKKARHEVSSVPETTIMSEVDLDCPDIKESEFDEDEISSYLLSPEEEEQLRTPKLKFICIFTLLQQAQLRWAGHVVRMSDIHIRKQPMYCELREGRQPIGGQKKRFKYSFKVALKSFNIDTDSWEVLAQDRPT